VDEVLRVVFVLALGFAVWGLLLSWRARPEPPPAGAWSAPIGVSFLHSGAICTVIDDGYFDGSDWREGVLCHYRDDYGRIRELFFTPAQWEGLKVAGLVPKGVAG
jgi:hypothetical protein